MPRRSFMVAFALFTIVALGYTPLHASGLLRDTVSYEASAPLHLWWMGIANIRHIVSYAALCLLAIASFSKQPVKAVGVTLLISVLVEVEQALFTAGHARIRDLVPNVIAVCLAALIWFGAKRMLRTRRGIDDSPAAD